MSNPLSARTVSPGTRFLRREQCSVMYLSLVRPPHPSEIKLTVPWGVIPIKCYDAYIVNMSGPVPAD